METKIISILSFFFVCVIYKSDMSYLGTIMYISVIYTFAVKILRFENVQVLVLCKLVSMVTLLLLGNTTQMVYFIFH